MAVRTAIGRGFLSLAGWLGVSGERLYSRPFEGRAESVMGLIRDHKDLLSSIEHRDLLNACRWVANRFPVVSGAIEDKANHVVGNAWGPQFDGEDIAWGDVAEDWLIGWSNICDVRGYPHSMTGNLHLGAATLMRDGEYFIHLSKNAAGYPQTQTLESHRIGDRRVIREWNGYAVINGIAYNNLSRPVAYHFLGDVEDADRWIPARDMIHVYDPRWFSQGRGVSPLVTGILDWLDVRETRENEKYAQRLFSSLALKHKTPDGKPDAFAQRFGKTGNKLRAPEDDGAESGVPAADELVTKFGKGLIRTLLVGKEDIEALETNRPSMNQQEFERTLIRGALLGLGWTYEQAYDASKLGGASVRRDISKNQRSVERMQDILLLPWIRQVGWAVSCAVQMGILIQHVEWWKWMPQLPAAMTADAGRESKQDIEEYKIGFLTLKRKAARDGEWWQDVRRQRELETRDLLTRAQGIAEEFEVSLQEALNLLEQRTPNANSGPGAEGKGRGEEEEAGEEEKKEEAA